MPENKPEEKPADQKPEEKKPETTPSPTETAEKSLIDRIMGVVEDVMKAKLADFEKKIDGKIDMILKTKEVEVEKALRKGFGLEQDPVVKMSDLIAYGRKLGLEKSEPEKRTPGTAEPGPDGVKPTVSPIDKMFDEALGKKESASK